MRWLAASIIATSLHAVIAVLLLSFLVPQDVTEQPLELAKLTFGVVELDENRADPRAPDATAVDPSAIPSNAATIGAIPQRRADPAPLDDVATVAQIAGAGLAVKPVAEQLEPVKSADSVAAHVEAVTSPAARLEALANDAIVVAAATAKSPRIQATLSAAPRQKATPLKAARTEPKEAKAVRLKPLSGGTAVTSNFSSPTVALATPENNKAAEAVLASLPAPAVVDTGTNLTAELAFAGGAQLQVDDRTLASLQTFLSPDVGSEGQNAVRDDLGALLAGQDCARLQTVFLPETGTVELRGHVPNPDMRRPLLAALQERIGAGLPVQDNLLILPAPQCSVLAGIAALGLPQSDEQLTNPRMIGQDTHAKEYLFSEGDRLKIELTAPGYGAYVYVDYYDAEGQVIHLVPNDQTELIYYEADAPFAIGGSGSDSGLDIRIGPPFGQDIAVAFASSHPLFDEPRPLIEPAQRYLEALAERVAVIRAEKSDFKGEWAYLFVRTQAAQN